MQRIQRMDALHCAGRLVSIQFMMETRHATRKDRNER